MNRLATILLVSFVFVLGLQSACAQDEGTNVEGEKWVSGTFKGLTAQERKVKLEKKDGGIRLLKIGDKTTIYDYTLGKYVRTEDLERAGLGTSILIYHDGTTANRVIINHKR